MVYLFGLLHDAFDFQIESIQAGFPDCTARRKISAEKWKELRIEFESKQFVAHRHDPDQVEMIICWRHDWPECPKHIQVIALSAFVPEATALIEAINSEKKPLTAWQAFAQKHRLAGKNFAEISNLWKKRRDGATEA